MTEFDKCGICLVDLCEQPVIAMPGCPSYHVFHEACIETLLSFPPTSCPLCRAAAPVSFSPASPDPSTDSDDSEVSYSYPFDSVDMNAFNPATHDSYPLTAIEGAIPPDWNATSAEMEPALLYPSDFEEVLNPKIEQLEPNHDIPLPPFLSIFYEESDANRAYYFYLYHVMNPTPFITLKLLPGNIYTFRVVLAEAYFLGNLSATEILTPSSYIEFPASVGDSVPRAIFPSTLGSIAARRVDISPFFDSSVHIKLRCDDAKFVIGMVFFRCEKCFGKFLCSLLLDMKEHLECCMGLGEEEIYVLPTHTNPVFCPRFPSDLPSGVGFTNETYKKWIILIEKRIADHDDLLSDSDLLKQHRLLAVKQAVDNIIDYFLTSSNSVAQASSQRYQFPIEYTDDYKRMPTSRQRVDVVTDAILTANNHFVTLSYLNGPL